MLAAFPLGGNLRSVRRLPRPRARTPDKWPCWPCPTAQAESWPGLPEREIESPLLPTTIPVRVPGGRILRRAARLAKAPARWMLRSIRRPRWLRQTSSCSHLNVSACRVHAGERTDVRKTFAFKHIADFELLAAQPATNASWKFKL